MEEIWENIAKTYGNAQDLEEMNRLLMAEAVRRVAVAAKDRGQGSASVLELGCGNGKVLKKCISIASDKCHITGVDSSPGMLQVAAECLPSSPFFSLVEADILAFVRTAGREMYDLVFAANTLHNLPSTAAIVEVVQGMARLVKKGGVIAFDIRNSWNPFLAYGYWKNRRAGMQFFTSSPFFAERLLREAGFVITMVKPLTYETVEQAGKQGKPAWFKFLYRSYLVLLHRVRFALYVHIEAQKI